MKKYCIESGEGSILINIFPFSLFISLFNYVIMVQFSILNITIGFSLDLNDSTF